MRPYIKKVLKPIAVEPNKHHDNITYRIYRIKVTDLSDDKEIEIVVNSSDDEILITTDTRPFKNVEMSMPSGAL